MPRCRLRLREHLWIGHDEIRRRSNVDELTRSANVAMSSWLSAHAREAVVADSHQRSTDRKVFANTLKG